MVGRLKHGLRLIDVEKRHEGVWVPPGTLVGMTKSRSHQVQCTLQYRDGSNWNTWTGWVAAENLERRLANGQWVPLEQS